jgi:hypothetical protein
MVEQFRRSGLTRTVSSWQDGVPLVTLNWRLAETKPLSNLPAPVVFSEVILPQAPAVATSAWAMEVVRHDGLIVRCPRRFAFDGPGRVFLPGGTIPDDFLPKRCYHAPAWKQHITIYQNLDR